MYFLLLFTIFFSGMSEFLQGVLYPGSTVSLYGVALTRKSSGKLWIVCIVLNLDSLLLLWSLKSLVFERELKNTGNCL